MVLLGIICELRGSGGLGTLQGSLGTPMEAAHASGCALGSCLCQDAAAVGVTLQLGVRTGRRALGPSLAPTAPRVCLLPLCSIKVRFLVFQR